MLPGQFDRRLWLRGLILLAASLLLVSVVPAGAQTREPNPHKKKFAFSSVTIPPSVEWVKENDRWTSRPSAYFDPYGDYISRLDSGFGGYFSAKLVSFTVDTVDVYALRYVHATLQQTRRHGRMEEFPFMRHEYFFITKADVMRLTNLVEDVEVSIMPYHSIEVSPSEDKDDHIINRYLSATHSYWPEWDCKWKLTKQKNRLVVRFTLPYLKEKGGKPVFEFGPYYEISQTQFNRFANSIKKYQKAK